MGETSETGGAGETGASFPSRLSRYSRGFSFLCLCASLACVYAGLRELDGPVAQYFRSITTPEGGGTLTVPWLAFVSHAGNWLGDGRQLLMASAFLLALGWVYPCSRGKQAGLDTLWAHGLATVLVHAVKHTIGRPRPKFSTTGEWEIMPSLTSGYDSFPSGHTTATMALAVVLARRYPHAAVLWVGLAVFVGCSRVVRGSHFTTDVFGGMVLGCISGAMVLAPWKDWRMSAVSGVRLATIGTVWSFVLLWCLTHPAPEGWMTSVLMGAGALLALLGWWGHQRWGSADSTGGEGMIVAAVGLSVMTAAPLAMAAVGLLALGLWLAPPRSSSDEKQGSVALIHRIQWIAGLAVTLAVLMGGRGVMQV